MPAPQSAPGSPRLTSNAPVAGQLCHPLAADAELQRAAGGAVCGRLLSIQSGQVLDDDPQRVIADRQSRRDIEVTAEMAVMARTPAALDLGRAVLTPDDVFLPVANLQGAGQGRFVV